MASDIHLQDLRNEIERNKENAHYLDAFLTELVGPELASSFSFGFQSKDADDFEHAWAALVDYLKERNELEKEQNEILKERSAIMRGAPKINLADPPTRRSPPVIPAGEWEHAAGMDTGAKRDEGRREEPSAPRPRAPRFNLIRGEHSDDPHEQALIAKARELEGAAVDPEIRREQEELLDLQIKNEETRGKNLDMESKELKKGRGMTGTPKINLSDAKPASPLKTAAGAVAAGAVDMFRNRQVMRGSGGEGPTLFHFLVDATGGIPVAGSFITATFNLLQALKAFSHGLFGTCIIIVGLIGIDAAIAFFTADIGVDALFPSTLIAESLYARALAKKEAIRGQREEPRGGLFHHEDGSPTWVAAFFFVAGLAALIYGLWSGQTLFILAFPVALLLLLLSGAFRQEFVGKYGAFFLITLGLHLWFSGLLGGPGFAFSLSAFFILLALYAVVALLYLLWSYFEDSTTFHQEAGVATAATIGTLIMYALPGAADMLLPIKELQWGATFFALILPVWPLVMLEQMRKAQPAGYSNKFFAGYVTILVLIGLVFLVNGLMTLAINIPDIGNGGVDTRDDFGDFGDYIRETWEKSIGRFGSVKDQIEDPGEFYKSQIEPNEREDLGVHITSVRFADEQAGVDNELILYGKVRAKSFFGESVLIAPYCYLDEKDPAQATVDFPVMEVIYGQSASFQCLFPPPLPKGSTTVVTAVTFPFETWAYIRYTFVEEEFARNIAAEGKDITQVLSIPVDPEATSTNGPIMLGMGGSDQPITIAPDKTPIIAPGRKIGITLDNTWSQGELRRVNRLEIKVPDPFSLKGCDREHAPPARDGNDPLLTNYVFENREEDIVRTFTSITCDLAIEESRRDEARELLAGSQENKLIRSFVGVANYEYSIEEKETVRIR